MIEKMCDWIEHNYVRATLVVMLVLALLGALAVTSLAYAGPAAPTVTLTATPTSGVGPLNFTLSWSSTGASTCNATGGWNGAKALSGSQSFTGLAATATYTLTCSAAGGWADLTWTPPTQNTDGTPLTDLADYRVAYGTTPTNLATTVTVPVPASGYGVTGLAAGPWYFTVSACNVPGVCSIPAGPVTKTVAVPAGVATATVTINTVPKPPTGLVVTQSMAYEIKDNPNGVMLGRNVGTVPLGTACGDAVVVQSWGANYHSVPRASVIFSKAPKSVTVVAVCARRG